MCHSLSSLTCARWWLWSARGPCLSQSASVRAMVTMVLPGDREPLLYPLGWRVDHLHGLDPTAVHGHGCVHCSAGNGGSLWSLASGGGSGDTREVNSDRHTEDRSRACEFSRSGAARMAAVPKAQMPSRRAPVAEPTACGVRVAFSLHVAHTAMTHRAENSARLAFVSMATNLRQHGCCGLSHRCTRLHPVV